MNKSTALNRYGYVCEEGTYVKRDASGKLIDSINAKMVSQLYPNELLKRVSSN